MRRWTLTLAIATVLFTVLLVFSADGTGVSRTEMELSWDDGSAEDGFTSWSGVKLAVGFQAPESLVWLRAVRLYIMDDGIEHPVNPGDPTTENFMLWVWRDTGGVPGVPASDGQNVESGYAEEAWLDVVLAEPIDLSNEVHFPERRFHVGLEWEHGENPFIGLDLDAPHSGETRCSVGSVGDTADAMIRAVVCDSTGVPVEVREYQ
jgi:hypothetical protein